MESASPSIPIKASSSPSRVIPFSPGTLKPFPGTLKASSGSLKSCSVSKTSQNPSSSFLPTNKPSSTTYARARVSEFAPAQPRRGADVLVEALERAGVGCVFAYPGGAAMEIHQALTLSPTIRCVLCCHEQGEVFAAEGYARASGRPGVCIATSTNLVSGLADALLDSVPLVAVTGQVPRRLIGADASQEAPILEVTRPITKHNYLVLDAEDIPRIVQEAFFLASSGRPGPVLIDIPKDVQRQMVIPDWNRPMKLHGYLSRLPKPPEFPQLEHVLSLLNESKKPLLYVGGGCLNSSPELRRFVELTGIPVASSLMGLGVYPSSDELSLGMLGMHGTVYANYAVDRADLLLALGARFSEHTAGRILEAFASRAKIIHIDIDPVEIGKNRLPHFSICSDVKAVLQGLNSLLEERKASGKLVIDFTPWRVDVKEQKMMFALSFNSIGDAIPPQYAIHVLDELTDSDAIITTGAGQHQMWAAKAYNYKRPRQLLTSGGLGAMGFGLPAAIGAAMASPGSIVVDIDGDGSFIMNIQELATAAVEQPEVKMIILNNQCLGMVAQHQLESRVDDGEVNMPDTYLGILGKTFPNFQKFAEGCNIPAARVTEKSELRGAVQKMLETPGPYLLDVIVPHQELVLPILPSGGASRDVIIKG